MSEEKTLKLEETSAGVKQGEKQKEVLPQWREIIIQFDGNSLRLVKAEIAGRLEMLGILKELIKNYESK